MAVQVSYPGVYIDEFAPGAPIQGVGTSTAAFVGPTSKGVIAHLRPASEAPVKVTSWDQFLSEYGDQPIPGHYLWYAVRGFFENQGSICYIFRVSNGAYDERTLQNRGGNDTVRARATQPGANANPLQVSVVATNVIPAGTTSLYQPTGSVLTAVTVGDKDVTLNAGEGAQFRPGDQLFLETTTASESAQIVRVNGDTIRLDQALVNAYAVGDTVRLADAGVGARTIRILPAAPLPANSLTAGTVLTIDDGTAPDSQVVESVQAEPLNMTPPVTTYRITFRQGLNVSLSLDPNNPATVQSEEFDFSVIQGSATKLYANLSADSAHPRYFVDYINARDESVRLELIEPRPLDTPPNSLPVDTGGAVNLTGGANEDLAGLGDNNYIAALNTLRDVDDINLVAIPDRTTAPVQQAMIAHCEEMADRFAVLDSQHGLGLFGTGGVETQRRSVDSTRGYAALYYPWLRVLPAGTGAPVLVPPSGHMCGVMARVDARLGVHKAPANENINGAMGVAQNMSDIDQGSLNLDGINVIRVFQAGGRPIVWGARTTATNTNWQYVNIRRLFLYLEESIAEGIRWAVFEPSNLKLWQQLKLTISDFLTRVWKDGGLFGASKEEAFYVRIDETLNPFSEQALGRLNIEIGVRPTYPAEFIIVRIGIWDGGSEVSEG